MQGVIPEAPSQSPSMKRKGIDWASLKGSGGRNLLSSKSRASSQVEKEKEKEEPPSEVPEDNSDATDSSADLADLFGTLRNRDMLGGVFRQKPGY